MAQPAPHPPLALIANHQEWSARSLESILGPNGYTVLRASRGSEVLDQAKNSEPDVYIVDAELPDISGFDVCRWLRSGSAVTATTPILLTVAGPSNREQRLEGLRAGAWDFFGLPLDAEELLLKLDSYVRAKTEADHTREQGLLDQLSGLYNIRGLLRRARELGSDASRHRRALACVVFSPELPGPIGGGGQRAGSEAAEAAVAHRLARVFKDAGRVSDAIGRLGPTEFVVLAPDTDAAGAFRLAERFSQAAENAEEAGAAEREFESSRLSLRAGYYAVPDFRDASIEPVELLVRATQALRNAQARREGEERIQFFDPSPSPSA